MSDLSQKVDLPLQEKKFSYISPLAITIFLIFISIYAYSAPTTFQGGDAGLFSTIYEIGGFAHPPGYPLYSAYLYLMEIPGLTPAHGAAVSTALLASFAVTAFYCACKAWLIPRYPALTATILFGTAPYIWLYQVQPEVFALNHLLAALIFCFSGPSAPATGRTRLIILGLLAGLGTSHHHSIILLAPIGFYGVYLGWNESNQNYSALGAAMIASLLGLVPYLYLLWAAYTQVGHQWGNPTTLHGFLDIFLRREYGSLSVIVGGDPRRPIMHNLFLLSNTLRDTHYIGLGLGIFGIAPAILPSLKNKLQLDLDIKAMYALLFTLALTGPVFVSLINLDPTGIYHQYVRKFHLLFEFVVFFCAGFGIKYTFFGIQRPVLKIVLPFILLVFGIRFGLPHLNAHTGPQTEEYLYDTFDISAPKNAIIFGAGDLASFGFGYFTKALNKRPDLDYLHYNLLLSSWYRHDVERELPIKIPVREGTLKGNLLIERLLELERPLFVTDRFHKDLFQHSTIKPVGTLIRIYSSRRPAPSPESVFELNRNIFEKFTITVGSPPKTSWSKHALSNYAQTWRAIYLALRRAGNDKLAQEAKTLGQRYLDGD